MDNVRLGRIDQGIQALLDMYLDGGQWGSMWLPAATPARQHERFAELVRAAGLDDFWDEVGWPPQCSRDGDRITCN